MKFFHGRMKRIIRLLIFLNLSFAYGEDVGQLMPNQNGSDYSALEESLSKYEVDESKPLEQMRVKGSSGFLPGVNKEADVKTGEFSIDHGSLDKLSRSNNYLESKNEEIFKRIKNKSITAFHLSYIRDTYTYSDPAGIFEKTYETESTEDESHKYGYLHFGMDKYFSKGYVNWMVGFNFGLSLNQGVGRFINSTEESRAIFSLWVVPVDFVFSAELPISSYFKLAAGVGPSIAGIWQSRSDRDQGDEQKNRRQISYGFNAYGKAQISLSRMFPSSAFKLYSENQSSQLYVDIYGRVQSFENFKDPLSITGASFGIGFSFEYL